MRICLASLHPRVLSGQIDSLTGLGRSLAHRGHEVALVAPFDTSELLHHQLTDLDNGPTGLIPAARVMLKTVPRIIRAAAGHDLLHLALPTPAFSWLGDLVQLATSVPVVASFEGHLADVRQVLDAWQRPHALSSYLPLWAINNGLLGRFGAHLCATYAVSSEYQHQELLDLGFPPDRIAVVPNVVEDGKLTVCEPRLARRELGLPADGPIVGYVGHFNDVKGVDVLASAFTMLAARGSEAALALAWSGQGDGTSVQAALAGVDDRVHWLDKVHVGTFMCAVDVLALPYRSTAGQGAYPSLVLEALEVGTPLVTTDLPMLREITGLGPVARICPPDRPDLLADEIEHLLDSEEERAAMSETQRSVARSHFAPERLVGQYEALYASLLPALPAQGESGVEVAA